MTYMSSIERIGMEIGRMEGRQQGRREALAEMLTLLLSERFGELDAATSASLAVADADRLTRWTKNVLGARSLSEVFAEK